MLINRTPFRVSFLGGGTDLPWFYEKHGGAVVSIAINRYMYLSVHPLFESSQILLKYSQRELVADFTKLRHPIAREILKEFNVKGVDISVSADVPAGSGLGSSSAFAVGLYDLISRYSGVTYSKYEIADAACRIEIEKLQEPIGKQDQFASAFGGLKYYKFHKTGEVEIQDLKISEKSLKEFSKSLYLVKTLGESRSASKILQAQREVVEKSFRREEAMLQLSDIATKSLQSIEKDIFNISDSINLSWELKKISNPFATNAEIDRVIEIALQNGASSGKLLGAGESGFILFICREQNLQKLMNSLPEYHFNQIAIDFDGTKVVYDDGSNAHGF